MAIDEHIEARRSKLAELRRSGVEPYPVRAVDTVAIPEARKAGDTEDPVGIAGRLTARREHGKTLFADLKGQGGSIQLYFRRDQLPEELWRMLELLDLGDIVWVKGPVFTTRMGELTVRVVEARLLAKSLRPIPVVKTDSEGVAHDEVTDRELLYRHRCVDLLVNPSSRKRFEDRARIISALRSYLDGNGFLEVETPILQPLYGGAAAEPFVTHYQHQKRDYYLRIATELYLKRAMVGGFERVYELGKDFRNEGVDRTHSPEFTQLELYEAYGDYQVMMRRMEDMVECSLEACGLDHSIVYQGTEVDLSPPFRRIGYVDSLREASGEDLLSRPAADLRKLADRVDVAPGTTDRWTLIDKLFDHYVADRIVQPTFVVDYPEELSPLAKARPGTEGLTERFEVFVSGLELGNSFSEQNAPTVQREKLVAQAREDGVREGSVDEDFLYALETGMPPAGGLGVGLDRLVMLLTDADSIRDTILFPHLRLREG
ncbi:lysine--tRNA ligase [Candidatus Fermentibacteria bacterium]|nr:lysine--tRNA ligase [Candidatus Fermentibacteria bacterium]